MIKVSVIVPVYKVPLKYLRACLDSLTAQTLQECEFIVVSDGAPEAECAICEEYAQNDARFKFFIREHAGVSATRNYGIEQAQGEYITFVDADDVISNKAFDFWYKKAKEWNSDIIASNYAEISANNKLIKEHIWNSTSCAIIDNLQRETILKEFIHPKSNSISRGPWGKLYRQKFLLENTIKFCHHLQIGEDLVFNFDCFNKAPNISFYSEIHYHYREVSQSVTRAFNPNYFYDRFAPILEIHKTNPNKYEDLLGREVLEFFFGSWNHCYMNAQNAETLYIRVKKISQIINNIEFQYLLSKANTENMTILVKLENFLFKRKIIFPIWLHAIKAFLKKFFFTHSNFLRTI